LSTKRKEKRGRKHADVLTLFVDMLRISFLQDTERADWTTSTGTQVWWCGGVVEEAREVSEMEEAEEQSIAQ
jgi:hypothetical protein